MGRARGGVSIDFSKFLLEFHPPSKSGPESPHSRSSPATRLGGVPKVAPEPSPYMVLRAVWLLALRLDGVVVQTVAPELDEVVFQNWGGVPKSVPRIPTLYTTKFKAF